MSDFRLLGSSSDYEDLKNLLSEKITIGKCCFRNEPTEFPCICTYCMINDTNGFSFYIKHISVKDAEKMLTELENCSTMN
mgnify:CR=1 FL=1